MILRILLRGEVMLKTITMGSCVSVQGLFVRELGNGKIEVRVDQKTFIGYPISGSTTG